MAILCNPLEADTRKLIDTSLENLGWIFKGKEKNVYLEQPRTEEERQALEHKRPDYVLYSKDHEPLIVIEAKKKGERIDSALEQGIFYAQRLKAPLVYATDGVFCKAFHVEANRPPLLNGNELDEFIRQALALRFMGNYDVNTVSPKVQYDRKELIKIFDNANNMLRGDGLRAGIERFGEFANILFIKLLSEKGNIDDSCSWETIKRMPISTRINYINNTVYNTLNANYNTEIFTPLTMRDNEILDEIMKSLDPLTLTDVDSDVKGDAFEYFLKASTASGNDLGEYFTPRHIVKTMVRLTNPQIGEKVYDPFCGTGGFLIESFRHIYNNMPRNEATEKMLRENTIFGNEITNTARITKMNMILAGDGHSGIHKIDSLANPVDGKYDVVLANMPYSQKTKWGNLYDVPSKNGDSICVQHCMKAISSTSENGRMALVVPEGFLFRKDLKKTREYLLENSELQSIISLPQGVFLPYTGVKTDIIYATKVNQKIPSSKKRKNYWYFEVKNDGYSLDNYRRKLDTQSDLQKYEEYRKLDEEQKEEMQKIGFDIIPFDKVKENDFNFVGTRYKELTSFQSKFRKVKLGDIAEFINGYAFKKQEWRDKGIPIIRIQNLTNLNEKYNKTENLNIPNKYLIEPGDMLISWSGSLGFYLWNGSKAYLNQHIFKVNLQKNILKKYLYYLKDYIINQAQKQLHGGTMKHITKEDFCNIEIPLPPLEIQEKIVRELEDYQNIIDGAQKIIEKYKPNINVSDKCNMVAVGDVVEFLSGVTLSVSQCADKNGIPLITIADIDDNGIIDYDNIRKVKTTKKVIELRQGDLLFNWRNGSKSLVGKTALFDKNDKYIFASFLLGLRPKKCINSKFLWLILNQYRRNGVYLNQMRQQVNGLFNREELKDVLIPLPSIEEQKQIVNIIGTEQELIRPAYKLIELFTQKIHNRINQLFEEK